MDELNWDNIKGLLIEEYKKREEKEDKECNDSSRGNEALFSNRGNFASSRGRNPRRGGRNFGNSENFRQGLNCYKMATSRLQSSWNSSVFMGSTQKIAMVQ